MGRKRAQPAPFMVYGGDYQKFRAGRAGPRPLIFAQSMHFTMRSSRAQGPWSFRQPKNHARVKKILQVFAEKHGIKLLKYAIHLNHLHLQLQIGTERGYKRFIRAVTAAIAMAVTGASRWCKAKTKFWDRRPFSRPVLGERARIRLEDYIEINELEAIGYTRAQARFKVEVERAKRADSRLRWQSAKLDP